MIKRLMAMLCIVALLFPTFNAYAQAARVLPFPASPRMTSAVEGTLQQNLYRRGYGNAANDSVWTDPRAAATVSGIGGAVATVAVGSAVAVAGLPVWAGTLLATLAGVAVPYALTAAYNWIFNPDGTISMKLMADYKTAVATGPKPTYFDAVSVGVSPQRSSTGATALEAYFNVITSTTGAVPDQFPQYSSSSPLTTDGLVGAFSIPGVSSGFVYINPHFDTPAQTPPVPPMMSLTPVSPETAINMLPDADLKAPLNPYLLARIINDLWAQSASQPGYQGVPYSPQNPITVEDVQNYQQSNPGDYPTVRDWLSPQPQALPYASPGGSSNTGTGTGTGTNPDTGAIPITSPAPGTSPTPNVDDSIPAPPSGPNDASTVKMVKDAFGDWSNAKFDTPGGSCPAIALDFDLYQHFHITSSAMCDLFEQYRAVLQAIFSFAFLAMAVFRVFSA